MRNYIPHIVLFALILPMLFFALLVSPYKYEWEPELMQVDDDAVSFLRLCSALLFVPAIVGIWFAFKKQQKIKYFYLIVLVTVCFKLT